VLFLVWQDPQETTKKSTITSSQNYLKIAKTVTLTKKFVDYAELQNRATALLKQGHYSTAQINVVVVTVAANVVIIIKNILLHYITDTFLIIKALWADCDITQHTLSRPFSISFCSQRRIPSFSRSTSRTVSPERVLNFFLQISTWQQNNQKKSTTQTLRKYISHFNCHVSSK